MLKVVPKKFKVHSLTGRIDEKLMLKAWKAVKRNRGASGIDNISVEAYEKNLERNLERLMKKLKTRGAYKCAPLKRVYIPKGKTGKLRPLGIPTIEDRIAQEVIRQLIDPIFERMFHNNSFGFRLGRGCHQAVEHVIKYRNDGYKHIVDIDIKGFFDNIEHDVIMTFLRAEIADGNVLDIIETFLRSGVKEEGKIKPTTKGTPQGGVISPLLANITLNYLDWQLSSAGYKFVRYADDMVILCKSRSEAENALDFTLKILNDLGLENSPEKTKIARPQEGFEFLGFEIKKQFVVMRRKSREKLEDALREATTRKHNLDAKVIEKLNRILRGTINYFCTHFSHVFGYFRNIESWLRRRIRSMKYKNIRHTNNFRLKNKHIWKRGLLRIRNLCLAAKARCNSPPNQGKRMGVARCLKEACR